MLYGMEYTVGQLGLAVPSVSSSSLLTIPSLLSGIAEWETEKAFMLFKHCSAIVKTIAMFQLCFGHKSKMQHHKICYADN